MKKSLIIEIIIMLYSILFLYTGISKLIDYPVFKEQLAVSPVIAPVSTIIAALLPFTEFAIVLLLIIPRLRLLGFYASAILMTTFTIYIIIMMLTSDNLPCSCGGIISELSWGQHIIFNTAFIGLAITGILLEKKLHHFNRQSLASAVLPA